MSSATPSSLASVPASSSIIPVWPNDRFTLEELPTNVLDGIDFWAEHTPDEPAIKFPRGPTTKHGFEIISYSALQTLRNHAATWLAQKLNLACPAAGEPGSRTIAFLVSPTHEVIVPWMALAAMGYTCQFVSPAHQPDVVANLIFKSHARAIIHSEMDPTWLAKVFSLVTSLKGGKQPDMLALEQDELLIARYTQLQNGALPPFPDVTLHQTQPEPFVILHSFGSTSTPKLYPLPLSAANMSARDSAWWGHKTPCPERWRCQLQTSLPFHFSFQNPVWRALKCGTTLAFPLIDSSLGKPAEQMLTPTAEDILNSLWLSASDILYCSPSGLQNMLEASIKPGAPSEWRQAVKNLRQAHTGAAPVSDEKSECYDRHGLHVFQVFATTEAGLLFFARKDVTGNLTWLKPLPARKEFMLFRKQDDSDVHELWLTDGFPGLLNQSVNFEPYPNDPTINAWNTLDTFRLLPPAGENDDLVTFAGRQDDWIRCTHGTAARALEVEEQLVTDLRQALGFHVVKGVTIIGNGKAGLGAVIELDKALTTDATNEVVQEALAKSTEYINDKLLHYPAALTPANCILTNGDEPIHMTQKGSIQRKLNEAAFGPELERRLSVA